MEVPSTRFSGDSLQARIQSCSWKPSKYPDRVQGRSTQINTESAPQSEVVEFRFPARDNLPKVALPEVKVYWYDGGMLPQRPDLLPDGVDMMRDGLGVPHQFLVQALQTDRQYA